MLEVHYATSNANHRPIHFIIDISELEGGFNYLMKKTGVYIDPYGDTKLYPEHQQLLIDFFRRNNSHEAQNFVRYLEKSVASGDILKFVGD